MDSPQHPRKPHWFVRWFSPLRSRLWLLTLPLVFWGTILILLFWPGLRFDWSAADWLSFKRGPTAALHYVGDSPGYVVEKGTLRFGPLRLEKGVFYGDVTSYRFFTGKPRSEAGLEWGTNYLSISYRN